MPPTIFIALGVIVAALVAGFFSFLSLVSAKENKVSEFRLTWLNGLRNEIATFTAAVQELTRIESLRQGLEADDLSEKSFEEMEIAWLHESRSAYKDAIESLSSIQMRLNPKHVKEHPESPEAKLMECIATARTTFNEGNFEAAGDCCNDIRDAAAPLLKSTWDLVKLGEPRYRQIRLIAQAAIIAGIAIVLSGGLVSLGTLFLN